MCDTPLWNNLDELEQSARTATVDGRLSPARTCDDQKPGATEPIEGGSWNNRFGRMLGGPRTGWGKCLQNTVLLAEFSCRMEEEWDR